MKYIAPIYYETYAALALMKHAINLKMVFWVLYWWKSTNSFGTWCL